MMTIDKLIISWLQIILFERYGNNLEIKYVENFWIISCANESASIKVSVLPAFYQLGKADFSCFHWSAEQSSLKSPSGKPLVVMGQKPEKNMIVLDENGATIQFDILGLVYWCLSRSEEVDRDDLDSHGRFSAKNSHAYQNAYLERPIVDEWLHILGQIIERVWANIKLKEHQFTVKVSHDVDAPSQFGFVDRRRFIRRCGASLLLDKNVINVLTAPLVKLGTKDKLLWFDAYNNFDWLMSLSEKYGLTSAFYFICGRTDKYKDADYDLENLAIRQLMRDIHQRGHEIGLHPSYNTFKNANELKKEANHLRKVCTEEHINLSIIGGRMHYLRWEHPYTMLAWNDAGLDYDSTMSYADHAGFRCGTCFEYPAINPVTKETLHLKIRPLIAMECSVMGQEYMNLGVGEKAKNKFLELAETCQQVDGSFTMLWHNSEFSSKDKKKLYKSILRKLFTKD